MAELQYSVRMYGVAVLNTGCLTLNENILYLDQGVFFPFFVLFSHYECTPYLFLCIDVHQLVVECTQLITNKCCSLQYADVL